MPAYSYFSSSSPAPLIPTQSTKFISFRQTLLGYLAHRHNQDGLFGISAVWTPMDAMSVQKSAQRIRLTLRAILARPRASQPLFKGKLASKLPYFTHADCFERTNTFYYLTRFMFAFVLISLFFAVCSLFLGLFALCSRIGSYLSSVTCAVALFFQTIVAALMT